ncbi:hypothetical protein SANTM175S_05523 [Streptomyces antimycoticus]
MAWCIPLPSAPTTAMANTVNGSVISASTARCAIHSPTRPIHSEASPVGTPTAIAAATASTAPATERPLPSSSRLSTSRPR